jgi:hypothetical protein
MDVLDFEYPDYERFDKVAEGLRRKSVVSILNRRAARLVKEDEKVAKKTKSTPEPKVTASKKRKPEVPEPKVAEAREETPTPRDENSFGIFRNSGNRFRIFSIGFTGNDIFQKQNRFSEFSIGIGIRIGVVFYRPFPSVTGFCRKLPDLCLGIFRNCVSEFFGIVSRNFSELSSM